MGKVGFIGLGIMGRPMAVNLVKAKVDLLVNDLSEASVREVVGQGAVLGTLSEIGEKCDIIFMILPNGDIVRDVLFGKDGICSSVRPGTVICDMSSVTPTQSQSFYKGLKERGVSFVDAPVSGGEPGAIAGTLAIMAGGEPAAFDRLIPYFDILGSSALLVGESGSGSMTKLANQIIVNMTIATVSEAFVLAAKAGVDPLKVYQAIRGGLAGSAVLDAKIPMIAERNFKPGGKISINRKDIKNVIDTAHELDVPVPLSSQLFEIMQALKVTGHMEEDHGGIVQYFEALAGVEVKTTQKSLSTDVLSSYPPVDEAAVQALLEQEIKRDSTRFIVLDDDPTGVQTVHQISVYTDWSKDCIRAGLMEDKKLFYLLTNSRSMTGSQTTDLHREIARNTFAVAKEIGQKYLFISRSDSTLRGHYPLETEILREEMEQNGGVQLDGEILCFFFREGGRYTIDNIHYVKEGEKLIPAGETEFAKDRTFGYRSSDLCSYFEEKTEGKYSAKDVVCISLDMLRHCDYDGIEQKLLSVRNFNKVVVNAVDECDLKVFCIALYRAMQKGKKFLFRSAASLVKIIGGISGRPLLSRAEMMLEGSRNGGIVVVGSHTNKTTAQLNELLKLNNVEGIEFNSDLVLEGDDALEAEIDRVVARSQELIKSGRTAVCYTKRNLLTVENDTKEAALLRSVKISDGVQALVGRLPVTPAFVVAKGGITSSDVGTKALAVKRADVMGQIRPGIPVWRTEKGSKFPGIPYVIFPGNVGEVSTLKEAVEELIGQKN